MYVFNFSRHARDDEGGLENWCNAKRGVSDPAKFLRDSVKGPSFAGFVISPSLGSSTKTKTPGDFLCRGFQKLAQLESTTLENLTWCR